MAAHQPICERLEALVHDRLMRHIDEALEERVVQHAVHAQEREEEEA